MNSLPEFGMLSEATDEATLIRLFSSFCSINLPPNPALKGELIMCIQHNSGSALRSSSWYRRESLFPPMPDIWCQTVEAVFENPELLYLGCSDIQSSISFLSDIRDGNVLNHSIVDAYVHLLRQSGAAVGFTLLEPTEASITPSSLDNDINYEQVRHGQVFVPIFSTTRQHWSFVRLLLDPADDAGKGILVEFYDSGEGSVPSGFALWYQRRFAGITCRGEFGQSPKQCAGSTDCGLYMLMGIRLLSIGSLHLSQLEANEMIPSFRYRMLAELLASNLNPSVVDHEIFMPGMSEATHAMMFDINGDMPDFIGENAGLLNAKESPEAETYSVSTGCDQIFESSGSLGPPRPLSSRPRKNGTSTIGAYVDSFADQKAMLRILSNAVRDYRTTVPVSRVSKDINFFYQKVEDEDHSHNTLLQRYYREQYSRLYYQLMESNGSSSDMAARNARKKIKGIMGIPKGGKAWRTAQSQASKASIWTQLVNFFEDHLRSPCVVLCATDESNAALEAMNKRDRDLFFAGLQRRIEDSKDNMLVNLKAASALTDALLSNSLPNFTLAIERTTDLGLMDFMVAVGLKEKLRLPNTQ